MVFVAGQAYVLAHTAAHERSRGFALFVGAIMVAAICGPPIGGILADHLGARWSFAAAAAIAFSALFAVSGLPAHESGRTAEKVPGLGDFARLLANGRFLTVSVLAAAPAKLILAGFCFYLVPLYVGSLGATPSSAGRALMVYAASLVLVLPHAARLAERGLRHEQLVLAGLCISGGGGLVLLAQGGLGAVFVAMLLLGFGQGLSIAAQSSLVAELCGDGDSTARQRAGLWRLSPGRAPGQCGRAAARRCAGGVAGLSRRICCDRCPGACQRHCFRPRQRRAAAPAPARGD